MKSESLTTLRARHSSLKYLSFQITPGDRSFLVDYHFRLEPDIDFRPRLEIPSSSGAPDAMAQRLVFLIGMVELLSYWKSACPKEIIVEAGALTSHEISWWEKLYREGLGEFFYLNKLSPHLDFTITAADQTTQILPAADRPHSLGSLVLVGGGKDSVVTLDVMRRLTPGSDTPLAALCINPIPASLEAIALAGYPAPLVVRRQLDPRIKELNAAGYLNGHTPFSAFLAFTGTLVAWQNGLAEVLASNETSASEGNIVVEGVEINHQYSKSFAFENNFRSYLKNLGTPVNYFSILRPLNELQICALFSRMPAYHAAFRSCNREQTAAARERASSSTTVSSSLARRNGWCGLCPKCVFTFLCLVCFMDLEKVDRIFGASPLEDPGFSSTVRELAGLTEHKPFECVGTYLEVQLAIESLCSKLKGADERYAALRTELLTMIPPDLQSLSDILGRWDKRNFLPAPLAEKLRRIVTTATEGLIS